MPKNILFVGCFRAVCRPLVFWSGNHEQCRLKLAATFLCTTGNRHTVRRRHPTRCSNADISCFSENYVLWIFFMIVNALLLLLCSGEQFALRWQIYLNIKMHGSFTCFTYPWKTLSHFIISSVLVFCNGLTPFYGYALRTFFTRKKGLGMLHVVFHGNSATYHCC